MATYDLIIRGGTIVDGTGSPRFTGDLAVKDGLIAAVWPEGKGAHGDAAEGQKLAPGWNETAQAGTSVARVVDVHRPSGASGAGRPWVVMP